MASWLVFGLVMAALLKVWFPSTILRYLLGGRGFWACVKAAVVGTPLPLCSCSVLPAAMELHRSGASKGATVSFLVATPENGADSLAVSYVLLGPWLTAIRLIAALTSAVAAGVAAQLFSSGEAESPQSTTLPTVSDCCQDDVCEKATTVAEGQKASLFGALRYAFTDLLDDLAGWIVVGVVLAAAIETFVPPSIMATWGSGWTAMLGALVISVPMYICATASTPVAASLLAAGVSPGTVLVFLLAGPATNLASAFIIRRELGARSLCGYLIGVIGISLFAGLTLDQFWTHADFSQQFAQAGSGELLPYWLTISAAIVLAGLFVRSLGKRATSIAATVWIWQRLRGVGGRQPKRSGA